MVAAEEEESETVAAIEPEATVISRILDGERLVLARIWVFKLAAKTKGSMDRKSAAK